MSRALFHQLLPYLEIARLLSFAILVVLVIQRRTRLIIVYVAVVATAVGITQIEAWPFANWALVHTLRSPQMRSWEIEARDASGRWWAVDPRVLQPVAPEEFGSWMFRNVDSMDAAQRAQLMRFLLARAEAGRRAKRFPPNDRIVGELSAPFHFRQRRLWQHGAPPSPFVEARIVELSWNVEVRARKPDQVYRRVLLP